MTPYRTLLAVSMRDRESFEMIRASGEADHFQDMLAPVWVGVLAFYERDAGVRSCDPALLIAEVRRTQRNPKHADAVEQIIKDLAEADVSAPNARAYLEAAARERVGDSLSASLAIRRPSHEILGLIQEYMELDSRYAPQDEAQPDWAALIARRTDPGQRLALTPKELNDWVGGGLLPGHNVTLFGRPESGKSALAISMACGFARRGHKVLYVGNEDPIEDIALRAIKNLTGILDPSGNPAAAALEAVARGLNNLVFRELSPGSLGEAERLVRIHKPEVLIVDQLRNLTGGKLADNFTQLLDRSAQGIRAIGKKYKLVTIAVTQAGDSARGKPVLNDGDIDSSNTGIPGAADVLIGVGVTEHLEAAGQRMLSICKNKPTGRHGFFPVQLHAALSRVRSK